MFDINTANGYFLHLVKCAIKDEQPQEKPDQVTFEDVYKLAFRQKAVSLAWYSIEKLNSKPNSELYNEWRLNYKRFLYQTASQEIELEKLIDEFTVRGYDVMPLKGSQIRAYYPQPDMRTMGDIDLLIKTDMSQQARDEIKLIMLELGYEVDILNDGQVDGYKGTQGIYVEIHFEFMHPTHSNYEHFVIDWNKLKKEENSKHYSMTLVDLYYYNIGHFAKNMRANGNGFRAVVDAYVLWNQLSDNEKSEIDSRLEKINLKKLNDALIYISGIWFDDKFDDSTTQNLQNYLLGNSLYGYDKNRAILSLLKEHNSSVSKSAHHYLFSRFFPSADELYARYNVKKKSPLMLVFLWFRRIVLLLFSFNKKRRRIKAEVDNINKVSKEEIEFFKSVYDGFGLESYYK